MRFPRTAIPAVLATIAIFFSSCQVELPKSPLVQTVAVLPFDNESNDVNASDIMQKLTYLALKPSAYQVSDIEVINKKLADVGIVDGGQLPALDPVKMGKDFGVQALMYGSVESFDYTNVGYFLQRKVTLYLRMVDASTGQTIWENTGTGAVRQFNLNSEDAQKAFVAGLADQLVDKLFNTPLEGEARIATIQALRKLPGFTFTNFAPADKEPNKVKKEGSQFLKNLINKK